MWKNRSKILLIALMLVLMLSAQEHIRFVSYNVENLFDCIDNPHTNDDTFLPESIRHWTVYRYWNKLQAIGRTIASIGEDRAPDIVALYEVENDSVMHDLTCRSPLRSVRYQYLITSSNDPRGINVALMYKPTSFRPFAYRSLRLPKEQIPQGHHVRDALLVSGVLYTGDTLDLIVCHLPSRLQGKSSARLRRSMTEYIGEAIDSVNNVRTLPNIIMMGDCNDSSQSHALRPLTERGLLCITDTLCGSYRYKGKWEQIDHIFLSSTLLHPTDSTSLHLAPYGSWNYTAPFLTEPEPYYGGYRPLRTYNGMRYQGGISDHLPVCFDLCFQQ